MSIAKITLGSVYRCEDNYNNYVNIISSTLKSCKTAKYF